LLHFYKREFVTLKKLVINDESKNVS